MKRKEKRIYVMKMLRAAINDSMSRHPMYNMEYWDEETRRCDFNDCKECGRCNVAQFIISLYDKNHTLVCRNWLENSFSCFSASDSEVINRMSNDMEIDITHLMWGKADKYLHLIRYIRIGERMRNTEWDEIEITETGREYIIFGNALPKRYVESWESEWRSTKRRTR